MNKSELLARVTGRLREFDQMYRRDSGAKKLEATAGIWTDALMEYAGAPNFDEAFDRALLEHVKDSKYFPTPAEVIAIMKHWLRKERPVDLPEPASQARRTHNAQVAEAIRLAIRRNRTERVEGLKRLVSLNVLNETIAGTYL